MDIILELYQIIFILSTIFILSIVGRLLLRIYEKFSLRDENAKLVFEKNERLILWISLTIFFSFLL